MSVNNEGRIKFKMSKFGIMDRVTHQLLLNKSFKSRGLAAQWLQKEYPTLIDTDNRQGHYLGGQSQPELVLKHPVQIVCLSKKE